MLYVTNGPGKSYIREQGKCKLQLVESTQQRLETNLGNFLREDNYLTRRERKEVFLKVANMFNVSNSCFLRKFGFP